MATKVKQSQPASPGAKDYFVALQKAGSAIKHRGRTAGHHTALGYGSTTMKPQREPHDKNGAVTITLHSAKDDFDEKAQVKVELKNPDAVVEKMLQTLANKFPPDSVMTIATGAVGGSDGGDSAPSVSGASSSADLESKMTDGTSSSRPGVGLSPLGHSLLEPDRLSGRHYLGDRGECYPELADSKGRPIDRFVRDPVTGGALPVGPQAYDTNGTPIPRMIVGPHNRPIPGLPVPPEGLDPKTGRPRPCYDGIGGTRPWEAIGKDGRPLLGFAIDPDDGIVKPVGPAVLGPDGRPIPGVIRGPDGEVLSGIPLKPVPRISDIDRLQPSNLAALFPQAHGYGPADDMTATGVYGPQSSPPFGGSGDRPPTYDDGRHLRRDGRRGILRRGQPDRSVLRTSGKPTTLPSYMDPWRSGVTTDGMLGDDDPTAAAAEATPVKIAAPGYPLEDGSIAVMAVGPDGRPMDGYGQDPLTGRILQVGKKYADSTPNLIIGEHGAPAEGLPIAPSAWDEATKQPIPHYLTTQNELVPMPIGRDGRLLHGLARDLDGVVKPVGLQMYDPTGSPIPDHVIGADGRAVRGIALRPHDGYTPQAAPAASATHQPRGVAFRHHRPPPQQQQPLHIKSQTIKASRAIPQQHSATRPTATGGVDGGDARSIRTQSLPRSEDTAATDAYERQADGTMIPVKYVEVPIVQEKIVHVPKTEYVEIEKKVPKYEVETVERVVEVPRVEYIDREVEVPKYEEVVREMKVVKVVDVPKEVIKEVKKVETKIVEKHLEVPGPVVEVPKVNYIEQKVYVPRYIDKEVPTIVAQKLEPVIHEVNETYDVPCTITEPNVITVDVYIPKPVQSRLRFLGKGQEVHTPVSIPPAQFNSLTKRLNQQLEDQHLHPLFVREGAGVPLLPAGERVETVEPVSTDWAATHNRGKLGVSGGDTLPAVNIQETLGLPRHRQRHVTELETESDTYDELETRSTTGSDDTSLHHHVRRRGIKSRAVRPNNKRHEHRRRDENAAEKRADRRSGRKAHHEETRGGRQEKVAASRRRMRST